VRGEEQKAEGCLISRFRGLTGRGTNEKSALVLSSEEKEGEREKKNKK